MQIVFAALQETSACIRGNADEASVLLSRLWGNVPVDTVRLVNSRRLYEIRSIGAVDVGNLSTLNTIFVKANVIRSSVDVAGIPVWDPKPA